MEGEENSHTTLSKHSAEGHRKAEPSPVVHVRGLLDSITEEELVEALQDFGAVRFDCVETAQAVRAVLQGAELFSGCCSLRIEFAKPSKLSVLKNDSETRDYTVPPFYKAGRPGHYSSPRPLLESTRDPESLEAGIPSLLSLPMPYRPPSHGPPPPPPPPPALGRVLMLHGLEPSQFNCERVFNLLCVFGNVELVKFLRNKPGVAMVQMGDEYAVERAVMHLNNSVIFDSKIGACVSKQPEIIPGRSFELEDGSGSYKDFYMSKNNRFTSQEKTAKNRFQHPSRTLHFFSAPPEVTADNFEEPEIIPGRSFELEDGSGSYKDFYMSKNNRFTSQEKTAKNRFQHPSRTLHFFSAPPEVTADNFEEVCDSLKLPSFCSCKIFPPKNKSSSGLIEWDSIPKATEALVVLNHHLMRQADQKVPYTLRLCFSNAGDRE
ncbi:UNVERIFIED_CONTAM: hypothetical protein FKN15_009097 [Acipenser sinensis]